MAAMFDWRDNVLISGMKKPALALLIYLHRFGKSWLAIAVGCFLMAMLYSMIPSFERNLVLGRVTLAGQPLKDSSISFTDTLAVSEASGLINETGT